MERVRLHHSVEFCHSAHPRSTKYGCRLFVPFGSRPEGQISHEDPRRCTNATNRINVQSAGVTQEEQIFYTNDDDETEEQYWARKEAIRKNPAIDEPTVTIQRCCTTTIEGKTPSRRILREPFAAGCPIQALRKQSGTNCTEGQNSDKAIL